MVITLSTSYRLYAAIPIKNKIFLIHGEDKNFQILKDVIINAEKFHHLV